MAETTNQPSPGKPLRWYEGITPYQWWVMIIAAMAWGLDTMAQRLFILVRTPALKNLMGHLAETTSPEKFDKIIKQFGTYSTASMMVGWAIGGFYFGIVGDRWGRTKTLSVSILAYSIFTGLSGFSMSWWDFCIYRFLMGCGIGGAFATGATLIAETVPSHSRAWALGLFQALSAVGNIFASLVSKIILPSGVFLSLPGWRILFFMGAVPAILVFFIMKTIREPDAWLAARASANAEDKLAKQMGDIRGMFTNPRWRRNTVVGMVLAASGVVGLWGVGFWTPELIRHAMKTELEQRQGMPEDPIEKAAVLATLKTKADGVIATGTALQDVGAFFGMFAFTFVATRFGRRISFGISFIVALLVVSFAFLTLSKEWHVYVLLPMIGFVTLSVFGGYSIYFPEIFPTRFRATGTAFCYNAARIVTAVVIVMGGAIQDGLKNLGVTEVFRWGAVILCSFYLIGLVALIWAPETKDQPLPED